MPEELNITQLQERVRLLVKRYQQMKEEHALLEEKYQRQQEELKHYKQEVEALQKRLNTLQLASTASGKSDGLDKSEIRTLINEYIKEIDRCIATLND